MRLALDLPPSWPILAVAGGRLRALIPGRSAELDLILEIDPLVPAPDDTEAALTAAAARGLAQPGELLQVSSATASTRLGWPLHLLHAEVSESREVRVAALWGFGAWVGIALFRGGSLECWEAHQEVVRGVLDSGRPDWSGEVVAVAQLLR